MDLNFSKELIHAKRIAKIAGEEVLKIYDKNSEYTLKSDGSELTFADKLSHNIITRELNKNFNYPILSEENDNLNENFSDTFWVIDPLDGTKDFIQKTKEFSIMIGLIKDNKIFLGVVYCPKLNKLYYAEYKNGSYLEKDGVIKNLKVSDIRDIDKFRAIVSKNHITETELKFSKRLNIQSFNQKGSIGVKLGEIAEGNAEVYYNFDGLNKWDICAPQIILEEAGGFVCNLDKENLDYTLKGIRFTKGIIALNKDNNDFFRSIKDFRYPKKIIAISQRNDLNKHADSIDNLENNYINYLEKFNILLIQIPNSTKNLEYYFEKYSFDGIILTGGNDVDPEIYGREKNPNLSITKLRDNTEKKLLDIAIKKNIPVLGICRGMHFINTYFNGKLIDNINSRSNIHSPKYYHKIRITQGDAISLLGDEIFINTYHNQGIDNDSLSENLNIFAIASDNIIEGIYHPKLPIAGIQWHPERESPDTISNEKIIKLFLNKELFWKKRPKAIILAAGMGTRLGDYTKDLPKGMLNFNGKTLIERQIETLRSCGIEDIIIVKGYMPEKIQYPNVKYYENKIYSETNMVESLFSALPELNGEIIVLYSDIIYEKGIINKVLSSNVDIGVVVDDDYWDYWSSRLDDPYLDIESLIINNKGNIIELGETSCEKAKANFRYVGIIKFSNKGTEILKKVYFKNKLKYYELDKPWLKSKSFKKAYFTCLLQSIINEGHIVSPIIVSRGWLEFDTTEDYEKTKIWVESGKIKDFFDITD